MLRPKRTLVALLLTAVVVAGCASGDADDDGPAIYGAPGEASTTTAAGQAPPADGGAASPTTRPGSTRSTTTTRGQAAGATSSDVGTNPTTTEPVETASARLGPPGSYARELLGTTPAKEIVVEVISQEGVAARPATIATVEDVLEDASRKPVTLAPRTGGAGAADGEWDANAIVAFADQHGSTSATRTRPVVRFLALKGGFGPDPNAIGVAVRGDVFAVFVEGVNRSGTPLVDAATIEQAVAVHEVGHLLGLVDIALDRNRDDPDHPHHSRNRGSVMFWAIETDLVSQILGGPPPRSFDADDQRDLADLRTGQ